MTDYKSLTIAQLIDTVDTMTGVQVQDELTFNDNFLEAIETALPSITVGAKIRGHYLYYRICKNIEIEKGKLILYQDSRNRHHDFFRAINTLSRSKEDWLSAFTSIGESDPDEAYKEIGKNWIRDSNAVLQKYTQNIPSRIDKSTIMQAGYTALTNARILMDGTMLCSLFEGSENEVTPAEIKERIASYAADVKSTIAIKMPELVDEFETYIKDITQ